MKTLIAKKVLKISLFICLILAVGQISIQDKVVGEYFVTGVKNGGIWCGSTLAQSKVFASLSHPKFLDHWFPLGEKYKGLLSQPVVPPPQSARRERIKSPPQKQVQKEEADEPDETADKGNEEKEETQPSAEPISLNGKNRELLRQTDLEPITASDHAAVLRILE